MLKKVIYYRPEEYPKKEIILLENMQIPAGDYSICHIIENKINEYLESISVDINLFILEIEKSKKELYRESDEFAWIINNEFKISEMNNPIVLDGKEKNVLLNSYELFEPIYKIQLENIYNFLKSNYDIDEYFRKKYNYQKLKNKFKYKEKESCKKI